MPRSARPAAAPASRASSDRPTKVARTRRGGDDAVEKNRPLVEDIRLLGRILGDVIREQDGKEAFELIERIRQLSVAYRLKRDAQAGRALDRLLKNLSGDQTVSVIRAFSYFSHLANIAEDRHHVRRREHHESQGHLQEGSLAMCFERLARNDIRAADIAKTLSQAYISPVLTAHPTEVQRKSILDAERAVAALIHQRDELRTERERARQRRAAACARHAALADAPAAQHQAHRAQRDRERDQLLPRHVPARDPAHVPRDRAIAARLRGRAFLSHGQLDRRRPRRQPQRHRRHAAARAAPARRGRAALLPDRGARARRRAVDLLHPGGRHGHDERARRQLARHQRAPPGRALSPRADRHVRAAGRHAAAADRHRGAAACGGALGALRGGGGVPRRPAHHRGLAQVAPRIGTGRRAAARA